MFVVCTGIPCAMFGMCLNRDSDPSRASAFLSLKDTRSHQKRECPTYRYLSFIVWYASQRGTPLSFSKKQQHISASSCFKPRRKFPPKNTHTHTRPQNQPTTCRRLVFRPTPDRLFPQGGGGASKEHLAHPGLAGHGSVELLILLPQVWWVLDKREISEGSTPSFGIWWVFFPKRRYQKESTPHLGLPSPTKKTS